jgi:hypothetical protein
MRKIAVLASFLTVFWAGVAFAQQAAHNTGCGLGTILWENKADGSVLSQSLQATTNATFGNQTFGITSGTLGCEQPEKVASNERLIEFATANLDTLARDIARGQGESLDTMAELMEIPDNQRLTFDHTLQTNFDQIFTDGNVTSAQVIDRIVATTN